MGKIRNETNIKPLHASPKYSPEMKRKSGGVINTKYIATRVEIIKR
jgi:hypothetical protein